MNKLPKFHTPILKIFTGHRIDLDAIRCISPSRLYGSGAAFDITFVNEIREDKLTCNKDFIAKVDYDHARVFIAGQHHWIPHYRYEEMVPLYLMRNLKGASHSLLYTLKNKLMK